MRALYLRLRRHAAKTRRGHVNVQDIVQVSRLAREWRVSEAALFDAVAAVGTRINDVHRFVERNRDDRQDAGRDSRAR
jgi:hypothetical protein